MLVRTLTASAFAIMVAAAGPRFGRGGEAGSRSSPTMAAAGARWSSETRYWYPRNLLALTYVLLPITAALALPGHFFLDFGQ